MYKDGPASAAHSLLLLLTHRQKQTYTWAASALLEKADLTHRRNGSCVSPDLAAPDPLRLSRVSHNFENERFRVRQAYGSAHNKPCEFLVVKSILASQCIGFDIGTV